MSSELLNVGSARFERSVRESFAFLETRFAFACKGLTIEDQDPRDSGFFIRYKRDGIGMNVALSEVEWYLGALVRLDSLKFVQAERYVYFEPFVEFYTKGEVTPLVPQFYVKSQAGRVLRASKKLFASRSFEDVLHELAIRAERFLPEITGASEETIAAYQRWYRQKR